MKDIGSAIAIILFISFLFLILFIAHSEPGHLSLWTKLMDLSHHWIDMELQK